MSRLNDLIEKTHRLVRLKRPEAAESVVRSRLGKWQLYVAYPILVIVLVYSGWKLYDWLTTPNLPNATSLTCAKAVGPFTEKGTEILQANGRRYIPYGITISGLSSADYDRYTVDDDSEIVATADSWCGNTVRFQVAQSDLVGPDGTGYSKAFMRALTNEVRLAEHLGLVVVINDQTETVGLELGPTQATVAFWSYVSQTFGKDPQVVFDLFNEPQVASTGSPLQGNSQLAWQLWQDGGTYDGVNYIGMQALLNGVRQDGATNLAWIEGPYSDTTLSGLKGHLLTGGPLMYSIHHPFGPHNTATWREDFGYLVTQHIAPVVVGEWTNYASPRNECWSDAVTTVPKFLRYLASNNIGMTAWSLHPGVLIASPSFTDPTHIRSNYACKNGLDEGAGFQILYWLRELNGIPQSS